MKVEKTEPNANMKVHKIIPLRGPRRSLSLKIFLQLSQPTRTCQPIPLSNSPSSAFLKYPTVSSAINSLLSLTRVITRVSSLQVQEKRFCWAKKASAVAIKPSLPRSGPSGIFKVVTPGSISVISSSVKKVTPSSEAGYPDSSVTRPSAAVISRHGCSE